jgi:flagellar P-ring protein precursor FlgI
VRLKDLVTIDGVRDNQLHGIGVVVGLSGSGDGNAATTRLLRQMLATKNLAVSDADLKGRNVAMVAVTTDLPPFARIGTRLPCQVSCIGDAKSLRGGVLLQTYLVAPNGDIYAAAQGSLSVGGFGNAGPGLVPTGTDHNNIETVATLAQGALVERELPVDLLVGERLNLVLRQPDFTTAARVARSLSEAFGAERVQAVDAAVVGLSFSARPSRDELVAAIARVQQLRVDPDQEARVVINARTGTVVVGRDVRVTPAAVSHGGLSLRIVHRIEQIPDPANPRVLLPREVWVDPATGIKRPGPPPGIKPLEATGSLTLVDGGTVAEISNALNAIGARPRDMVAIFESLERAGALHARLVVL